MTTAIGVAVGLQAWLPAVAATGLAAIGVLLVVKRLEHETAKARN